MSSYTSCPGGTRPLVEPLSDPVASHFLVLPDEWKARKVPKIVQDYVLETHEHALVLGKHPEHGYYFVEVTEGEGVVFYQWWADVQDEALAAWAMKRTDGELTMVLVTNAFTMALTRDKNSEKKNIWERIHEAVVFEMKRRTEDPS